MHRPAGAPARPACSRASRRQQGRRPASAKGASGLCACDTETRNATQSSLHLVGGDQACRAKGGRHDQVRHKHLQGRAEWQRGAVEKGWRRRQHKAIGVAVGWVEDAGAGHERSLRPPASAWYPHAHPPSSCHCSSRGTLCSARGMTASRSYGVSLERWQNRQTVCRSALAQRTQERTGQKHASDRAQVALGRVLGAGGHQRGGAAQRVPHEGGLRAAVGNLVGEVHVVRGLRREEELRRVPGRGHGADLRSNWASGQRSRVGGWRSAVSAACAHTCWSSYDAPRRPAPSSSSCH